MTVTPSGLSNAKAALLEKYMRGEMAQRTTAVRDIPRRPTGDHAPLSFGQQQMWLLTRMAPEHPVYTECMTLRMPGPLDVTALERSFTEIVRRHEIWRTIFSAIDGEPTQIIHPPAAIVLPVTHLEHLPEQERETEAVRVVTADIRVPFDLAHGPLLRPRLVKISDDDHRLYLVLHHIVFDVVSLYSVFIPELVSLYEAFSAGKLPVLAEPAIQYADYAYWQRQRLNGTAIEQQRNYWRGMLADLPMLQLPTDHPRPAVPTYRGAFERFVLPMSLANEIKDISRREGVSVYMTLVAAFMTLLHRYAGQDDIVIGTPSSNRDRPEIEKTIGFFLNTLALRANLGGDPSFRDVVERVRSATLAGLAHQDLPFEAVVRDLQPQRNFAQNPIYQVLFTLEPPRSPAELPWSATMMDIGSGTPKLDISVELDDTGDGINGRIQYTEDLFEAETITRMAGHYRTLLEGIVADPGRRISTYPILTEDERMQMLVTWNATAAAYPRTRCLHELFAEQVARTPGAIAAVFDGEEITYQALDRRANQLARYLQACGVGPNTFVGICVERSLAMLVGLLGTLKAGGAYVPLDPAYPRDRLAFMLEDAQVRVLLTQQQLAAELPAGDATIICIDGDWAAIASHSDVAPGTSVAPENLAYMIYTSGSTGKPKGVMIPHRALVNFLCSMRDELDVTSRDVMLAATSLSFDIAGLELYLPLVVGARVVIAPREVAKHGRRLGALVESSRATIVQATPTTWRMLFESGWQGAPHLHILCGGEALPQNLARQLLGAGKRLTNLYGPTETTIWSTLHEVTDAEQPVPLGRPIANTQIYVLDRYRQPAPIGVPGELYIGGDGVARGYYNRQDLTEQRFVPDPFAADPAARMYATGDLARFQPDGTVAFLGRADNQVKVRGFRIELGEIETLLEQHDGVRHAIVTARDDVPGRESLAAYIFPSGDAAPRVSDLRQALATQLPDYMIPSAFVMLDAMPMTPNGKVDRKALPAPNAPQGERWASFVAPEGILQLQLARIWEEILEVQSIGITDDFFELGGTSLLAARLVDRIADVCGKTLPLASLFAGATIARIEEQLLKQDEDAPRAAIVQVQPGRPGVQPLFFLHGDLRDGGLYTVKLARALDADRPFYSIHPQGTDDTPVPYNLPEIAAERVKVLRGIQPHGPYLLGGFCAGAFVAFEMAQQLHKAGEQVDGIIMVEQDIMHPETRIAQVLIEIWGKLTRRTPEEQQRVFLHLRRYMMQRAMGTQTPDWIKTFPHTEYSDLPRLRAIGRLFSRKRQRPEPAPASADDPSYARSRRTFDLECRYMWAISRYPMRRYRGRAAMFWADDEHGKPIETLTKDWRKFVSDIDTFTTPGTHFSAITTNVEALAERMQAWLASVEAKRRD